MASAAIARSIVIVFGLLYPAYNSYKAIKTRNVTLYVKWMMYWIVFALFYNVETIADLLISWLPMYYELKAIFLLWLLSPATQGAEVLYRLYVHPKLLEHEQEIEETIAKVKTQGCSVLLNAGAQGMNLALKGAIQGQTKLAEHLTRSYSLGEIETPRRRPVTIHELPDEPDNVDGLMSQSAPGLRHRTEGVRGSSNPESPIVSRSAHQRRGADPTLLQIGNQGAGIERSQSLRSTTLSHRHPTQSSTQQSTRVKIPRSNVSANQLSEMSKQQTAKQSVSRDNNSSQSARIAKPVQRASRETSRPIRGGESKMVKQQTAGTQRKWTESTLRYRTKKISDIKHQKISSPFVSLW